MAWKSRGFDSPQVHHHILLASSHFLLYGKKGEVRKMKELKKLSKYFSQHPYYNSATHVLIGIGIGILITYPLVTTHPLRWGLGFLVLGLLGHLYPLIAEK